MNKIENNIIYIHDRFNDSIPLLLPTLDKLIAETIKNKIRGRLFLIYVVRVVLCIF